MDGFMEVPPSNNPVDMTFRLGSREYKDMQAYTNTGVIPKI
jgi:hypothetical protein